MSDTFVGMVATCRIHPLCVPGTLYAKMRSQLESKEILCLSSLLREHATNFLPLYVMLYTLLPPPFTVERQSDAVVIFRGYKRLMGLAS